MIISNQEDLRTLYGWPKGRAKDKILSQLEKHAKNFLAHAPLFILSTYNQDGRADASPRGGKAGFVKVLDEQTLLIPDAKGNNWVDSISNIVDTGRVGCLFLIPGINETLRINGKAVISIDPAHIALFPDEQNTPKSCILIHIEEVFLHCAKALMRSDLWGDTHRVTRPGFPTMGQMLNEQLGTNVPLETQAEMEKRYQSDL
ncbi:MAG: pyridoxamine 5'-phosphate oxidase family protein [Bacteroidota bacterium]